MDIHDHIKVETNLKLRIFVLKRDNLETNNEAADAQET